MKSLNWLAIWSLLLAAPFVTPCRMMVIVEAQESQEQSNADTTSSSEASLAVRQENDTRKSGQEESPDSPTNEQPEEEVTGPTLPVLTQDGEQTVILKGERAKRYIDQSRIASENQFFFTRCLITGEVFDSYARIRLDISLRVDTDRSVRVPLGVNGLALNRATLDGVPLRPDIAEGQLTTRVTGKGPHQIILETVVRIQGSRNLPQLSFPVPTAPITSLELVLPHRIPKTEVRLIPPASIESVQELGNNRIVMQAFALGPRQRVDIRWRWNVEGVQLQDELVRTTSQVEANIQPGRVEMRTTIRLLPIRGEQRDWDVRVPPLTRVLRVLDSDGRELDWSLDADQNLMKISLPKPASVGNASVVSITTTSEWTANEISIHELSVVGALSNQSVILIRSKLEEANPILKPDSGLSQIVDRAAIPIGIRPSDFRDVIAVLRSTNQPFLIDLQVLPIEPKVSHSSTTILSYSIEDSTLSAIFGWTFHTRGGRIGAVEFELPVGFSASDFLFADHIAATENFPDGNRVRVHLKTPMDSFDLWGELHTDLDRAAELLTLTPPRPLDSEPRHHDLFLGNLSSSQVIPAAPFQPFRDTTMALESFVLSRLPRTLSSYRRFRSQSPESSIVLQPAPLLGQSNYRTNLRAQLRDDRWEVTQEILVEQISRSALLHLQIDDAIRQLTFQEVPGQLESGQDGMVSIRLDEGLSEAALVRLRYQFPAVALDADFTFPIVVPARAICQSTSVDVTAPWSRRLVLRSEDWAEMRPTRIGDPTSDETRVSLRSVGTPSSLRLYVTERQTPSVNALTISKSLVDVRYDRSGNWLNRTFYQLQTIPDDGFVEFISPENGQIRSVMVGQLAVPLSRSTKESNMVRVDLSDIRTPATLLVESVSSEEQKWGAFGQLKIATARVVGAESVERRIVRLTLRCPQRVFHVPDWLSFHAGWIWNGRHGLPFQPASQHDAQTLAQWMPSSFVDPLDDNIAYVFSQLGGERTIQIALVDPRWLIVLCSTFTLVLGCVVARLPFRGRRWTLVMLAWLVALGVMQYSLPLIEILQSSLIGVLITVPTVMLIWKRRKKIESEGSVTLQKGPDPGISTTTGVQGPGSSVEQVKTQGSSHEEQLTPSGIH